MTVWDLLGRNTRAPFEAVLSCELAPGGVVGAHRQGTAHEIVVVLDGEGRATVNGEEQALATGVVVQLALGELLTLENASKEHPLRYLIVKARSGD